MTLGRLTFLCCLLAGLLPGISVPVRAQSKDKLPIYLDPKRTVDERVDDLMSRMTLKEKVGQLNLPCLFVDDLGTDIPTMKESCRRLAAGTYTSEIGPCSGFFTLADHALQDGNTRHTAEFFNELQKSRHTNTVKDSTVAG